MIPIANWQLQVQLTELTTPTILTRLFVLS